MNPTGGSWPSVMQLKQPSSFTLAQPFTPSKRRPSSPPLATASSRPAPSPARPTAAWPGSSNRPRSKVAPAITTGGSHPSRPGQNRLPQDEGTACPGASRGRAKPTPPSSCPTARPSGFGAANTRTRSTARTSGPPSSTRPPASSPEAWHALRSTLTATQGPVRIIGNVSGRRNWPISWPAGPKPVNPTCTRQDHRLRCNQSRRPGPRGGRGRTTQPLRARLPRALPRRAGRFPHPHLLPLRPRERHRGRPPTSETRVNLRWLRLGLHRPHPHRALSVPRRSSLPVRRAGGLRPLGGKLGRGDRRQDNCPARL